MVKETPVSDQIARDHAKPFVARTPTTRSLHFSVDQIQSRMDIRHPDALDLEYSRTMMGFLMFEPDPAKIAMIGLGGGSLAKFCYRHLPNCRIQVVEINPHVIALRHLFRIPEDNYRFCINQGDGADFLRTTSDRFSVLMIDGYDKNGPAASLSSQDFFDDCFEKLAEDGLLVINLNSDLESHVQHIARIRHSFDGPILGVNDRLHGNLILFARKGARLAILPVGQIRRPYYFEAAAWNSLRASRARIVKSATTWTGLRTPPAP